MTATRDKVPLSFYVQPEYIERTKPKEKTMATKATKKVTAKKKSKSPAKKPAKKTSKK